MENSAIRLVKKIFIKGTIKSLTGLHIGGSNMGMAIGGADSPVLRDPITNIPYIPGSSLKGKMRSLLEKATGNMYIHGDKADPCNCGKCEVCKIFGVSAQDNSEKPGRLIVRDAFMDKDSVELLEKSSNTDMPYTEVKTEVNIDRITSKANPRQIERVPAGTVFKMELVLDVYDGDDVSDLINIVQKSLNLVQDDYLGGSGTRGYGQVEIKIESISYKDEAIYAGENKALTLEV
ncbi:MAG: type III-A CRISPR-associated RAMP protein Csm3 [Candidatus Marinimicrobia bacterium]|nr:type III-A CRISPR-associated RAMP protein Csm3 [Candidatus Neomarinimicrobiota bacterium]